MASYLSVAGQGRSAFLQIHALDDGVFAEFPLNGQHGLLRLFFPFKHGLFAFHARVYSRVIRKEIKLQDGMRLRGLPFIDNVVGRDIDALDQQGRIGDPLKQRCDGIRQQPG